MAKKDYYEALGIEKGASADEIKQAFRRLAMKHHPDRHSTSNKKEAEERFKEISEAYEVLSDPQKRSTYDQYGPSGVEGAFRHGHFSWEDFTHFQDLGDLFGGAGLEDLFGSFGLGDLFRQGRPSGSRRGNGSDLEYRLELDLAQVLADSEHNLVFRRKEICSSCEGRGSQSKNGQAVCPDCRGQGQVRVSQGFFMMATTCRRCGGEGTTVKDPCPACRGEGRAAAERKLSVTIPAGVESGMRLKLSREGESGIRGGRPGDLYVLIQIRPHPLFHREGLDLLCEVPISMTQAALGEALKVPLFGERLSVKVPPGTQPGQVLRMRGKGMPGLRGAGRGDLLVRITVEIPARLNAAQRKQLEEFSRLSDKSVFPAIERFREQWKAWIS